MQHQQDYDDMRMSLERLEIPMVCIQHIMEYTDAKNYRSIYQECLKQIVRIVNDSVFLYHLEQVSSRDVVVKMNKDKSVYMVMRHLQFNTEYLRRCQRNNENMNLSPIDLIFYLALMSANENTNVTDVVITRDVLTIPFHSYAKHSIIPNRRKKKM